MPPSKELQDIYPKNSFLWKALAASGLVSLTLVSAPVLVCFLVVYVPFNAIRTWCARPHPSDRFNAASSTRTKTPPPAFTMTSQYVTMRDGTRIAIDLYLPEKKDTVTSLPCILHQSRYFRSIALRWPWRLFVNQGRPFNFINAGYFKRMLADGYAIVSMDVRGTGASFGSLAHPWSMDERLDSVDMLDWITRQPWSNGSVGLWGISYEGTAAYLTASMNHPAVRACVPMYMFYDMYNDIVAPGGIAQQFFTLKWQELTQHFDRNAFGDMPSMFGLGRLFFQGVAPASRDFQELEEAIAGHRANWNPSINPLLNRDTPTDGGITPGDLSLLHVVDAIQKAQVPMLFYSGWYDQTVRSALQGFATQPSHSKVIIGPWNHAGVRFWNPDTQHSQNSDCDHLMPVLAFLEAHLSRPTHIAPPPPALHAGIEYFSLGANRWHFSSQWPPLEVSRTTYYLSLQDRALVTDVSYVRGGSHSWDVSTQHALTGISRWQATIEVFKPMKYTGWHDANHVVFTSAPLETPLQMVGTATVTLWLSSSAPDSCDIFVYVTAIPPLSSSRHHVSYVTEGHFRAIHAQEVASDDASGVIPHNPDPAVPRHSYLTANVRPVVESTQVRFGLLPIAYRFEAGWSVQVRLVGHDNAHFVDVAPARTTTLTATALQLASLSLPIA
ncbi:Aste57867_21547 [Aphanomyces stellatus]|uniref:Aste57867_21547 protein n=1 Tax=Aphanomyces stellatus TaxID=120398 RepID=A0A485LIF8_9STRA|nr:hypothetical protein As57867_021478 [Aphanomyces stellatus]VFT98217.1 Aste57867_21547 [Aphanomyces stellatus]